MLNDVYLATIALNVVEFSFSPNVYIYVVYFYCETHKSLKNHTYLFFIPNNYEHLIIVTMVKMLSNYAHFEKFCDGK